MKQLRHLNHVEAFEACQPCEAAEASQPCEASEASQPARHLKHLNHVSHQSRNHFGSMCASFEGLLWDHSGSTLESLWNHPGAKIARKFGGLLFLNPFGTNRMFRIRIPTSRGSVRFFCLELLRRESRNEINMSSKTWHRRRGRGPTTGSPMSRGNFESRFLPRPSPSRRVPNPLRPHAPKACNM